MTMQCMVLMVSICLTEKALKNIFMMIPYWNVIKMVNENGDFLIAFFLIIACNINEQENLLDLSALLL